VAEPVDDLLDCRRGDSFPKYRRLIEIRTSFDEMFQEPLLLHSPEKGSHRRVFEGPALESQPHVVGGAAPTRPDHLHRFVLKRAQRTLSTGHWHLRYNL